MVVIDCEMTGLDPKKHSIVSVGAVDIENPERILYVECRAWQGAECDPEELGVNGFTKEQCFDENKKSLEDAMRKVHEWLQPIEDKTLAGQNVYLDMFFLNDSFTRAGIDFTFKYRILDIHTMAYVDHIKHNVTLPKKDGQTALSLSPILRYVGIPVEPRPHNALTGAMVSAEAISRLIYNKPLLKEFKQYPLPKHRYSFWSRLRNLFS